MLTRILIADNDGHVRKSIRMFLETESTIKVVGEAENGQESIRIARNLQPDIVLMDLSMPQGDGLQAAMTIKSYLPHVKIIILTMDEQATKVKTAMVKAGADGYVLKEADVSLLLQAIKIVQQGEMFLHPRATRRLIEALRGTS